MTTDDQIVVATCGPYAGMSGVMVDTRNDGSVVVRFDRESPFGAYVRSGVFDPRNLRAGRR